MIEYYKRILKKLDYTLVGTVALIIVMSLFVLNSATTHLASSFLLKQVMWIVIGILSVLVMLRFNYTFLEKYTKQLYVLNILILISVMIFGKEIKGAKSWIVLPGGLGNIQPSELSKLLLIITFASFLAKNQGKFKRLTNFIPAFLFGAIPLALILKQPDLGTTLVCIFIMVGMMFVVGANPVILGVTFGGGTVFALFYIWGYLKYDWWLPLKKYQLNRILVLFDSSIDPRGAGWNVWQSKIAIGSGGLFGKGLGEGTQSLGEFLPEQWTDFIFAVFAEEFGFLGAGLLLVLFFIVIYRGLKIANQSNDLFGSLIVVGVCSMYVFHILENVGMCIGIMPVTGIPLPFVSYGGSAMLTNMLGLGLILNVYVNNRKMLF
ncbi:rod shape determining protein RodA [Desulfonispora thiosulfatigenes DSM 11270]|uniref:Peptidoglycan glycosyltransferase RodA n=1 Tax=Desulfonispora thiosulfatigenes DSM 11270 TaxID=656914 RepID=A0A1W1VGV0_DESTI|nr:rod shape-determining protein RodA [Desulfonispora thiosulfatigenes]SMB92174.1 rod shape determining protein RodA [Desulfonispora thiosulfatigenes DSM 11270]